MSGVPETCTTSHYAESQGQISVAEPSAPVTGQGAVGVSVHSEMLRVLIPLKAKGKSLVSAHAKGVVR